MRVIAGKARRLQLKTPEGFETRPTYDRVKESLFNMINPDLYDCEFLDLFSGSGAIGIEALSRGAKSSVFVDSSKVCSDIIKENLQFTKLLDNAKIVNDDIFNAIKKLGCENYKFDIIFIDPPYQGEFYQPTLEEIKRSDILKCDGFIVAETAKDYEFPYIEGFEIYKTRKCGPADMIFLKLEEKKC